MSTIDGPKITSNVVPNEVAKPASVEKAAQTTSAQPSAPPDVVETASAQRFWGENRPASTPPPAPPADASSASDADAELYAENLGLALANNKNPDGPGIRGLADDALAAAFMKVNILDPDDNVETQNSLTEALSVLQQQGIANAKQEIKNAKERIREAQEEASGWGIVRICLAFTMPQCALFEGLRACGVDQESAGWLSGSLESGLSEHYQMAAKSDEQLAHSELNEASLRWGRGLSNLGLDVNRKGFEHWLEGKVQEARDETASAGEDGVPTKGLAKKLKPNMAKALDALAAVGDAQGLEAMLAAAPQILRDHLVPALTKLGVKHPEAIAESIAAAFCEEVMARAGDVSSGHALGLATMMLGHKLDADSGLPDDPAAVVGSALDAATEATKESPVESVRSFQDSGIEA